METYLWRTIRPSFSVTNKEKKKEGKNRGSKFNVKQKRRGFGFFAKLCSFFRAFIPMRILYPLVSETFLPSSSSMTQIFIGVVITATVEALVLDPSFMFHSILLPSTQQFIRMRVDRLQVPVGSIGDGIKTLTSQSAQPLFFLRCLTLFAIAAVVVFGSLTANFFRPYFTFTCLLVNN